MTVDSKRKRTNGQVLPSRCIPYPSPYIHDVQPRRSLSVTLIIALLDTSVSRRQQTPSNDGLFRLQLVCTVSSAFTPRRSPMLKFRTVLIQSHSQHRYPVPGTKLWNLEDWVPNCTRFFTEFAPSAARFPPYDIMNTG